MEQYITPACTNCRTAMKRDIKPYLAGFLISKEPRSHSQPSRVWATMQKRVYHTDVHGIDELRQRLIRCCCNRLLTSDVKGFEREFV